MSRLHNIVIAIKPQQELDDILVSMTEHYNLKRVQNLHITFILAQVNELDADRVQELLTLYVHQHWLSYTISHEQPIILPFKRFMKLGSKIAAVFQATHALDQFRVSLLHYIQLLLQDYSGELHETGKGDEQWYVDKNNIVRAIVHCDWLAHISFAQAKKAEVPPHQIIPDLMVEELFVYRGKLVTK